MFLVLSRRRNTLLLSFAHPVHANFRIQIDIGFIQIKYRLVRPPLGYSLLDGEPLFLIMQMLDFKCWRSSGPDHSARLKHLCNVAGCSDTLKSRLSTSMSTTWRAGNKTNIFMRAGAVCADILDYIEVFYNLERHHSHLSHFIPKDFEQVQLWGQKISTIVGSIHDLPEADMENGKHTGEKICLCIAGHGAPCSAVVK